MLSFHLQAHRSYRPANFMLCFATRPDHIHVQSFKCSIQHEFFLLDTSFSQEHCLGCYTLYIDSLRGCHKNPRYEQSPIGRFSTGTRGNRKRYLCPVHIFPTSTLTTFPLELVRSLRIDLGIICSLSLILELHSQCSRVRNTQIKGFLYRVQSYTKKYLSEKLLV